MPERGPLRPQIFGKVEGRDYSIEKVLIETLPGFYLGGNLYRPRNGSAKHPGVLNPHEERGSVDALIGFEQRVAELQVQFGGLP